MSTQKIAHLHIQDGMGNKKTLICNLKDGSITYKLFSGVMSSGLPHSLSNLQCKLPIEKTHEKESKEEFKERLIKIINEDSVYRVINDVQKVKF